MIFNEVAENDKGARSLDFSNAPSAFGVAIK
jgi:hypothetical protein